MKQKMQNREKEAFLLSSVTSVPKNIYFMKNLVGIICRKFSYKILKLFLWSRECFQILALHWLFCNPIIYAQYEQYMLVYQLWVTCWLLNHGFSFFFQKKKGQYALRKSTSISKSDKDKYLTCMFVAYTCMSSEKSLSEPAVSERQEGNSSGSYEDLPNRDTLCVRPLPSGAWRLVV